MVGGVRSAFSCPIAFDVSRSARAHLPLFRYPSLIHLHGFPRNGLSCPLIQFQLGLYGSMERNRSQTHLKVGSKHGVESAAGEMAIYVDKRDIVYPIELSVVHYHESLLFYGHVGYLLMQLALLSFIPHLHERLDAVDAPPGSFT
jgi:hypothetical protein